MKMVWKIVYRIVLLILIIKDKLYKHLELVVRFLLLSLNYLIDLLLDKLKHEQFQNKFSHLHSIKLLKTTKLSLKQSMKILKVVNLFNEQFHHLEELLHQNQSQIRWKEPLDKHLDILYQDHQIFKLTMKLKLSHLLLKINTLPIQFFKPQKLTTKQKKIAL